MAIHLFKSPLTFALQNSQGPDDRGVRGEPAYVKPEDDADELPPLWAILLFPILALFAGVVLKVYSVGRAIFRRRG